MKPTDKELRELVEFFQTGARDFELIEDGIYGPKTRAALREYAELDSSKLQVVWGIAHDHIGFGGDPGHNNVSVWIKHMRQYCDFPILANGPWCAIFVSYCLLRAGINVKSRGAYNLVEKLLDEPGFREYTLNEMQRGKVYVAVWKRSGWANHRSAHVRLVKPKANDSAPNRTVYEYLAGNEKPDNVVHSEISYQDFNKDLLMIVGEA